MDRIRTAVVGAGHLGSHHARIYHQLETAELVGVLDTDLERARECAAAYGVRAFSSLEELAGEVDAVSLAVPTDSHHELGCRLLDAGVHVLVEKPIASQPSGAAEMVKLAGEKNLVLAVGHVERFNPALVAASGDIEDAAYVESERLAPFNPRGTEVPVVLDLMIHDIDIVLSLVRSDVTGVSAVGLPVFTGQVDIANARLEFANGAVANVSASRVSIKKVRKMRFFSPSRYVSVDMLKRSGTSYAKKPGAEISLDRDPEKIPEMRKLVVVRKLRCDKKREPLAVELEDFLNCISSGGNPKVSGRDGLRALEVAGRIMDAIEKSHAAGIAQL
ncbi:MAG: Gfo/Idh/MocA family oxidoreductase [Candidatus Glassbacteria bacterium]|nr:Gfo/Idh/MocA family oxidoreductase [Candidatus Glassbacteria bacterium]